MSNDLPYRFEPTATAAELHERFDDTLDAGAETDETVTVAGRLMLRRVQGKLAFGTLQDATGRIQLFTLDGIDSESFFNKHADAAHRIARHEAYFRYVREEALPELRR